MTFAQITLSATINEIKASDDQKSAVISATFDSNNVSYPITIMLYGKAVELAPRLLGKLALITGSMTYVNYALTINSRTICPAAIPGFSQVTMMARLGKDPDKKEVRDGEMANIFALVSSIKKDDKASGYGISAFGKTAEIALKYLTKGTLAVFIGGLNVYEGKNGAGMGIRCDQLVLLPKAQSGGSTSNTTSSTASHTQAAPTASTSSEASSEDWSDIPF